MAQTRVQSACLEPNLDHANEIVNPDVESSSRGKRRKLRSEVWDDFTNLTDKQGKVWARCKQCKKNFDGSSRNGTSHLKKHLDSCRSRKNNNGAGDKQVGHEKGNIPNPVVHQDKFVINQEMNQLGVVRAIIKFGFSKPNFIKPDILRVYNEEKKKLCKYLMKLSCRFSLTGQRVAGDHHLTVLHFINDQWELKQKVIGFHHDYQISALKKSLIDFYFDKNICSVVTIEAEGGDEFMEERSSWLTELVSLPFHGHLFSASYIKGLVERFINEVTGRIQTYFAYICRASKEQEFEIAVENAKSNGKKVTSRSIPMPIVRPALEYLETAIGFKAAFDELQQIDFGFEPVNLTKKEWDDAEAVYPFLKKLNDAACSLSATKCHTANAFFPKICDVYSKWLLWKKYDNADIRKDKFAAAIDFCWSKFKLVLAIAVFLDPRFKMDIIERWYGKIYGDVAGGHIKEIVDGVTNVWREYSNSSSEMLDEFGMPITFSETPDLDLYLNTPKIPSVQDFDILKWWHSNSSRYPTLARMARDFLAVPISPSAFCNSSWEIAIKNINHRDYLDDDMKSSLICTNIWLESSENN